MRAKREVTPQRFLLTTGKVEVIRAVDPWLITGYGYFKVCSDDGIYMLKTMRWPETGN